MFIFKSNTINLHAILLEEPLPGLEWGNRIACFIKQSIYEKNKVMKMLNCMKCVLLVIFLAPLTCSFSGIPPVWKTQTVPVLDTKPEHPCRRGEPWPRPGMLKTRGEEIQERRLTWRVQYLENILHDVCSAIVYSDDMALVERQMLQAGKIHLDLSSNVTRAPLLLRRAVADIARKNGKPVNPPAHFWS